MNKHIKEDFRRQMFISFFKVKLEKAKENLRRANERLNEAIKNGSGQDIYDRAYEVAMAEDKYKVTNMCYVQISN
ncbi:hypothetical protein IJE86_11625 [bacterium]|nr:hypothetical protein [bacterium]